MMVEAQDMRIMEVLADATNVIAEGEVLQLMNMHNAAINESEYLHVIRSKTAKLFEASSRVGAILAKASPEQEEASAQYGQALGTAFQVIDDVLDYAGDASVMGKSLGDDLREGKATLPLISAMQRGNAGQRAVIQGAIETGAVDKLDQMSSRSSGKPARSSSRVRRPRQRPGAPFQQHDCCLREPMPAV
jgi:octaprenyl-diphosphate synthase